MPIDSYSVCKEIKSRFYVLYSGFSAIKLRPVNKCWRRDCSAREEFLKKMICIIDLMILQKSRVNASMRSFSDFASTAASRLSHFSDFAATSSQ